jgi:ketosteroid isomerase-like protein
VSQQNVDVVHGIAAALGRRDLDFFLDVTDPAVEWHTSVSVIVEGGAYHGHDGVRQYMRDVNETFEALDATLDRVLDVGDLVLAVGRLHYRGKASGVETDAEFGWVAGGSSSPCAPFEIRSKPSQGLASWIRRTVPRVILSASLLQCAISISANMVQG